MYEIWLALNIGFEWLLMHELSIVVAALIWIALMLIAAKKAGEGQWAQAIKPALLAGVVIWLISIFALPSVTRSSLSQVSYWVDWVNVIGLAAVVGALVTAYVWPLLVMSRSR